MFHKPNECTYPKCIIASKLQAETKSINKVEICSQSNKSSVCNYKIVSHVNTCLKTGHKSNVCPGFWIVNFGENLSQELGGSSNNIEENWTGEEIPISIFQNHFQVRIGGYNYFQTNSMDLSTQHCWEYFYQNGHAYLDIKMNHSIMKFELIGLSYIDIIELETEKNSYYAQFNNVQTSLFNKSMYTHLSSTMRNKFNTVNKARVAIREISISFKDICSVRVAYIMNNSLPVTNINRNYQEICYSNEVEFVDDGYIVESHRCHPLSLANHRKNISQQFESGKIVGRVFWEVKFNQVVPFHMMTNFNVLIGGISFLKSDNHEECLATTTSGELGIGCSIYGSWVWFNVSGLSTIEMEDIINGMTAHPERDESSKYTFLINYIRRIMIHSEVVVNLKEIWFCRTRIHKKFSYP